MSFDKSQTFKFLTFPFNKVKFLILLKLFICIQIEACIDGTSIIPLNKIVQRSNGEYFKCVPSESIKFNEATIVNTQIAANKDYQIEKLELRPLNEFDEEFNRFKAKKVSF